MEQQNTDQQRLEADVVALKQAFAEAIDALKSKVATAPQAPAASLDLSSLENLISEVRADVPRKPDLIPSDSADLATQAAPATIGGTAPSPFVDSDNDGEAGADTDNDGEIVSGGTTNDQIPAQSSEATAAPATDAASVVAPEAEITPSTEGQAEPAPANEVTPSE